MTETIQTYWQNVYNALEAVSFGGNTGAEYITAFFLFLGLFLAFRFFRLILLVQIRAACTKTKNFWDERITISFEHISKWFWRYMAFYCALQTLALPEWLSVGANILLVLFIAIEGTRFFQNVLEISLLDAASLSNFTTMQGVVLILKIILWVTVFLLVLSNFGINISALATSLGIGGIAIALAVQNILADLFASFSIYFDKPFQVGDYIVIGENSGTVSRIGLKTTRIKTLEGEELIISNKELTEVRVQNYKRMEDRRVDITLHFRADTPVEKLEKVPQLVRNSISKMKKIEYDYGRFLKVDEWSLQFEFVYYLKSGDWYEYVDSKELIIFAVKKALEKENIALAFLAPYTPVQR